MKPKGHTLTCDWSGMIGLVLLSLESPNPDTRAFGKNQLRAIAQWLDQSQVPYPWDETPEPDKDSSHG